MLKCLVYCRCLWDACLVANKYKCMLNWCVLIGFRFECLYFVTFPFTCNFWLNACFTLISKCKYNVNEKFSFSFRYKVFKIQIFWQASEKYLIFGMNVLAFKYVIFYFKLKKVLDCCIIFDFENFLFWMLMFLWFFY